MSEEQETTFTIPEEWRVFVCMVEDGLCTNARIAAHALSGMGEKEAVSAVANMLIFTAWMMATERRERDGGAPDAEQFMRMVKSNMAITPETTD